MDHSEGGSSIVRTVALGESGIIAGNRGRFYADLSTTGPTAAGVVARRLAAKGIVTLDAPPAGGVTGVMTGTSSVMVSGDPVALSELRWVLEAFGRKVVHVGDHVGQGQALKLLNNMIVGANLIAVAEGILFWMKYGHPAEIILDMLNGTTARI
ncbi:NAD(P)-dependent oxidoreductase [Sphingomonas arantia]|uniref:NAD(P)-dependent oxidoreductase n=1 Tax=Sphingomonas arantia TaxID=1460676 RepID=A0ABW4U0F6_9SPHN